jgi:serine/threonine protein kinase
MDPEVDALVRAGDIEGAARRASEKGLHRRAAELLALLGRHAEAAVVALNAGEWRSAIDAALSSGDERVIAALCDEVGKRGDIAEAAAAHARITQRHDVAARILEPLFPAEAGQGWYERGEYLYAARCFDRAKDVGRTIVAYEQHLAQFPEDNEAAERLAVLRAGRGDDEGAVRALQLAARHQPGPGALEKLIESLRRIGLEGAARVVIRRLRLLKPDASLDVEAYGSTLPRGQSEERYAGRYRVVKQVGSGASGRVLEAVDELTGETVALKVLAVGDDKGAAFARFMREAELARSLDDPTIVGMRALDPEGPTIVYDWMPGGTLTERIATLSLAEARAISQRVLRALSVLHRHGVVHRDIKPSNVLFDPAGQARLGDLGAAHLSDLGATVTGGLVGSLPYMSPEQITGGAVSAATDLYSFGCLLFQLLTGQTPFAGPDFVDQHLHNAPPKVSAVRPALGTEYDALIEALLSKDAEARPRDAFECERLLSTLSFREVDDDRQPLSRRSSIPPAPTGRGAGASYLSPTPRSDRWIDQRLGREVERVEVDPTRRETLYRWAALGSSDLQTIVDIDDPQNDFAPLLAYALVAADGPTALADELDGAERGRVLAALSEVGFDGVTAARAPCVRSNLFGAVALVRALARP